ncbi:rhomboid family intramembrane serine protease [Conservatibacter flavescens]|uniref:GlpG protein n=1 Tax=Conservatibacter flavescens TaxID=28161 RepID=A0A2M8S4S0_9PAST|nr:rhomboid family intramembrane serine protease [Conservatibacter flavescens]PJG86078.1 GlpG protein [Conservatibacter flavescens]
MQHLFSSEILQFPYYFRDYIRVKYQEELHITKDEKGIHVYLDDNSPHFDAIMQEKTLFLREPFAERYEQASWQGGDTQTMTPHKTPMLRSLALPVSGWFTWLIAFLCVGVYGLTWIMSPDEVFSWLHYPAYFSQDREIWRYVSHGIVHFSFLHLLLNLTWWLYLGNIIEKQRGTLILAVLFVASAIGSGVAQNMVSGPAFLGLSGVAYALGGYVFIVDKWARHKIFQLPAGFGMMLIVGIALGFAGPLVNVSIGNTAHITGLIIGIVIGAISLPLDRNLR